MRMKSDARILLNQRRLKKPTDLSNRMKPIDARKILNSKLGQQGTSTAVHRQFSQRITKPYSKVPEKHVKLARDGNIWITARSKNSMTSNAKNLYESANSSRSGLSQVRAQTAPQWTPTNIESADLEHIGLNDVLDMDSLPSAVVRSSNNHQGQMFHKSLAEEIVDMQNTMVADQVASPQQTTNVCVSNLHASVSKQDIMELFGDIGLIKHAQMSNPGIATIEYFSPADALKACELYHNRLLDGQPMQCYIQQPTAQRSFISQRLGGQFQSPSTSSTNSRTMYNPRNVRFTVKLT